MCCYRASIGLCTKHTTHDTTTRPRHSTSTFFSISPHYCRSLHFDRPFHPHPRYTYTTQSVHSGYLSRFVVRRREAPGITYHTTMTPPAALPPLPFNPARVRSYILRIPLFTRLVLLATIAFWVLELQTLWSVVQWGSLAPDEIGLGSSMFSPPLLALIICDEWC